MSPAKGSNTQTGSGSTTGKSEEQALREDIEHTFGIKLIDGVVGRQLGNTGNYFASKGQFKIDRLRLLKNVLERLPPHWRNRLSGKSIHAYSEIQKNSRTGKFDVAGVYWKSDGEVWVADLADYSEDGWTGVLYHELTHVLSFDDPTINENWRKIFWGGRSSPPPPPDSPSPTPYGNMNSEEDMADSVMLYKIRPEALDPVRRKFIERYIFNSR